MRLYAALGVVYLSALATVSAQENHGIAGVWEATVIVNKQEVPFRIEFAGNGSNVQGWFFNGDERVSSTSGSFRDGSVVLAFDHYASKLEAELADGHLEGTYGRTGRTPYPFRAERGKRTNNAAAAAVPDINGRWEIAVNSPKGESAWHLLVKQKGATATAAILRVDGDTGALSGSFRDGRFVLSHFSGARPAVLILTPGADGSLEIELGGRGKYTALRPAAARAKGLTGPTDPAVHTSVKNPAEPFRFRFRDLAGREVTESDARFQGKVLAVNITGSWCPNCHDEVPFLMELYRRYRSQGLEIVAISFEEAEQLSDPARLRAFVAKYGIDYPVLLGGEPSELQAKLPQTVNLNSWPTTFFIGRDGRVRHVHAGFAGRASGELHEEAKRQIGNTVKGLLAETLHSSTR